MAAPVLAAPGAFTLTSATPACSGSSPQVTLTWTAASGATTYDLYRNGTLYLGGLSSSTLSFLNTGSNVSAGTTYTYFIRARNSSGTTDSNSRSATAPTCGVSTPGSFSLTAATPSCDGSSPQITLTWTAASGATTYDLYRNGTLYFSGLGSGTLSFINVGSNVTAGTTYTYFIRARNSAGSTDSNSRSATASTSCGVSQPGAFSLTAATTGCDGSSPQITLTWTASAGATSYDLYRNGTVYFSGLGSGTLSFINVGSNVSAGTNYTYFIRARNSAGSTDSNSRSATAPTGCGISQPGAFTLTSATPSCDGTDPQITLAWTASTGATSYDLYRNGTLYFSGLGSGTLSFINVGSNVTAGTNYTYFIRARNSGGSTDSNSRSATAPTSCNVTPPPGAFTLTSAMPGCSGSNPQIQLNWTASSGASTYEVYRNGSLYLAGLSNGTLSFLNTGAAVVTGTTYTYFIRARNSGGTTDSGTLTTTAPNCASGPGSFSLTSATSSCSGSAPQVTLNWTASSNATTYDVYRNGALYSPGVPAGALTFLNIGSNVSLGTTYTYFIRAKNASGTLDSNTLQTTTPAVCGVAPTPGPFTLTNAISSCSGGSPQITLNWTTSANATSYDLYRNGTLYFSGLSSSTLSFLNTGSNVVAGATYTYFVRARNAAGSSDSNALQATANCDSSPGAFTLTSANVSCNGTLPQITLNWTASSGATSYDLYRNGTLYSPSIPPGTLSFLNTGANVVSGTTYSYFVRAKNGVGSTDSNTRQATAPGCNTADPTAISPGSPSPPGPDTATTSPTFSWTSVTGATKYGFYISQAPYGNANLVYSNTNVSGTSFTIPTALTNGVSYRWQVTAFSGAGESAGSNLLYFTVALSGQLPSAPTAISPGSPSAPGATIAAASPVFQWSVVNNATRYGLYVSRSPYGNANLVYTNTNISGNSFALPTALTNGTSYRWQATAFNASGESNASNLLYFTVSTSSGLPAAPTNLQVSPLSSAIALTWTDNAGDETGFKVERRAGSSSTWTTIATPASNTTSYTDSNVEPGVQYCYRVRSTNGAGDSSPSNEACATLAAGCSIVLTATVPAAAQTDQQISFAVAAQSSGCASPPVFTWNFGDGATANGASVSHAYSSPGPYSWNVLATVGAVSAQRSGTVTVSKPVAGSIDFTWSPANPVVNQLIQFIPTTTAGVLSWEWSLGDGASSISSAPTYAYTKEGSFSVTLSAKTANGTLTASHSVLVKAPANNLVADFRWTPSTPRAGTDVSFTDMSSTGVVSWKWTFGDSVSSTERNPIHAFARSGQYPVQLTVTGASGSAANVTKTVIVQDAALAPAADFTWNPTQPSQGQTISFHDNSSGEISSRQWDFNGDGVTDSALKDPSFAFGAPGTYTTSLRVAGPYGTSSTTKELTVAGSARVPVITKVTRSHLGAFLAATNVQLRLDVTVLWNGTPGTVRFSVNGTSAGEERTTGTTVSHTFSLAQFSPGYSATVIGITPVSGSGSTGPQWSEFIYVYPIPIWLQNTINAVVTDTSTTYTVRFQVPYRPISHKLIRIPSFVPVLAGTRLGTTRDLYALAQGTFSPATQSAFLKVEGGSSFIAFDRNIDIKLGGRLDMKWGPPDGFYINSGAVSLGMSGTVELEKGIVEAFPQVAPFLAVPVVGPALRSLNDRGKVKVALSPHLEGTVSVERSKKDAPFSVAGTIDGGLDLTGTISVDLAVVSAQAWAGGGGSMRVGFPNDFFKRAEVHGQIGARFTWKHLFTWGKKPGGGGFEAIHNFKCAYVLKEGGKLGGEEDFPCNVDSSQLDHRVPSQFQSADSIEIVPVGRSYAQYGPRNQLIGKPRVQGLDPASATVVSNSDIVHNVFDGASPAVAVRNDGKLLLWVDQNPALQWFQSTDVMWSYFDGRNWSTPKAIAADTQAEISPVVGIDANGRYVAAWLRIRDTAFNTPIGSSSDLPNFYGRFEVVTATFDPATMQWSAVQSVTNDNSYDFDPQLSTNGHGRLMLTWVTNAAGESVSTADKPASIRFSFWSGSNWSAPSVAVSGLAGLSGHAAAVGATRAYVVASTSTAPGSYALSFSAWDGQRWSLQSPFASSDTLNVSASIVCDSADQPHVMWIRNDDLMYAKPLSGAAPEVIRRDSGTLGFADARLVVNPAGNLTLIWRKTESDGKVRLFASVYDSVAARWSSDRKLTSDADWVSQVSAVFGDDGRLAVAYLNSQIEYRDAQVTVGSEPVDIPRVPSAGRSDLRVLDHSLVVDLAIAPEDVVLSSSTPQAEEEVLASVRIHNAGDFSVSGFRVGIYAGAPESGGVLLASERIAGIIDAGATRDVTVPFHYPMRSVVIVVNDDGALKEFTNANNRVTFSGTNSAPDVRIRASVTEGVAPAKVRLDATSSSDPENDQLTFFWTFGDGSGAAEGAVVDHTFTGPGTFPVVVLARDARGAENIAVVSITVKEPTRQRSVRH